ncbi:MAG: cyclic nucleotide-binding domain-containing protein [Actinomycetota bacterium]
MTEADRFEQLRAVPLFGGLSDDRLHRVAEAATPFEVEHGYVLAEHGQPGSGMFVILDGDVEVDVPNHEPLMLSAGEFVGELSLLTDAPRVARVKAATQVRGLAIGRTAFTELMHDEPGIAVAMLPILARRLVELEHG